MRKILLALFSFALLHNTMGLWTFPSSVDLNIDYYNNTNCENQTTIIKSAKISNICLTNDKQSTCCNDLLNQISLNNDVEFNKCYNQTLDNLNYNLIYSCANSKLKSSDLKIMEAFAFMGLIILFLMLVVLFISCIIKCINCGKNQNYNKI
jgi:hypothetical protein